MTPRPVESEKELDGLLFAMTVAGEPATKGRPRLGRGRTYTPAATQAAQELLGWEARAHMKLPRNDIDGLYVEIAFLSSNRQRRDIDNMAKLVLDALNGIVWRDDDQITRLILTKGIDVIAPRTEVAVFVGERRARSCPVCDTPLTLSQISAERPFCSKPCYDEAQRRGHYRRCTGCGTDVYRQKDKAFAQVVFCTPECRRSTWGCCRQCSGPLPSKHLRFCSATCRRAWYDEHQVGGTHAKGHCADCGRPTYNKTAVRCRPCFLDSREAAAA